MNLNLAWLGAVPTRLLAVMLFSTLSISVARSAEIPTSPNLPSTYDIADETPKIRWRLNAIPTPFSFSTQSVTDLSPTSPTLWTSSDEWSKNAVVLIVAPRSTAFLPSAQVINEMKVIATELYSRQIKTVFVAPNNVAAKEIPQSFAGGKGSRQPKTASSAPASPDQNAISVIVDSVGEIQRLSGTPTTKPSFVAFDRAGFVRNMQTVNNWSALLEAFKQVSFSAPIEVGELAPDFSILDMNGRERNLRDYHGRNLLLTFFPKCFTGHCSNHLTSIQAVWPAFVAADTDVLAVSVDPADGERGQLAFAKSLSLSFPLLPDTQRNLSLLYDAAPTPQSLASRMSVLIDRRGTVRWIDKDVVIKRHGLDVLTKIKELNLTEPLPAPEPVLDDTF